MKIIQAIFCFTVGGAETMLIDIVNEQCKTDDVSLIIVNDKVDMSYIDRIDKRVNILLVGRKEGDKLGLIKAYRKINSFVKKISPDVIHCHVGDLFPFFWKYRKITYLTAHSVLLPTAFFSCYKKIFAISEAVRNDLKTRKNLDSVLVYNGIRLDKFVARTDYQFDASKDIFRITQIGRLNLEWKRQDIAIQAMAIVAKCCPEINFRFDFISDENEKIIQILSRDRKSVV